MMSGRQTLASIERTVLEMRSEEDRLLAMLRSATDEAARLRLRQAEDFRALAAFRLDELSRTKVVSWLDRTERQAADLLARHRETLAAVSARRSQALAAATAAEAEHASRAAAAETAGQRVEAVIAEAAAAAQSDPAWRAQRERVAQAVAMAEAAAAKAKQAEADRVVKGRPYEDDPLFMYLWRCGFGTSGYRAGPLRRLLDGKVARLIDYDRGRPNYLMLTEMPRHLHEHAERLSDDIKAQQAAQAALERRFLERAGIGALETARDTAETALAKAEAEASRAKAALAALDAEPGAGDPEQDPDYRRALGMLAEGLGREDLQALQQKALATPSREDDRIVQSLQDGARLLAQTEGEIQRIRQTAVQLAARRAELERSQEGFRSAGYDNPRGGFINGDLVGSILGGILGGSLSSGRLVEALRDGYRQRADPGFGGERRPAPWGLPAGRPGRDPAGVPPGGPWGTGPTNSSGKGDGFRTGGGF
jgi:hypothetical protein